MPSILFLLRFHTVCPKKELETMKKSQSCKLLSWYGLLIVSILSVACLSLGKDYEIEVEQGVLVGKQYQNVTEFKGIPFAAPPIGSKRFGPPQSPQPWQGKKIAHRYGASCIQGGAPSEVMSNTSEDCLFLNVPLQLSLPCSASSFSKKPALISSTST